MKLLIAIPTVDYIHHLFAESLNKLTRKLDVDGIDYDVKFQSGTLIYLERDALVKYAVQNKFTHMLWLDADMVFSDDILDKFMKDYKPFVSCIYVSRHRNKNSVLFDDLLWSHRITKYPEELFRIEGCGFGCVLMETKIPQAIMDEHGTCFIPSARYGEDLAFCEKVLKHGYEMWANPNVIVGHIGNTIYYPD